MESTTTQRLDLLKDFRAEVWGNDLIFKEKLTRKSGPETRTVEYLNFGNHFKAVKSFCKAVKNEKLLVVREYVDAVQHFKSESSMYKNGACILGQPGIGKSVLIAYAVVERLREQQPVAVEVTWPQRRQYLLFHEEGVDLHHEADIGPLESRQGIWAFSDSSDDVEIPTVAFKNTPGVRTFQTTAPAIKRWKEWTKQTDVYLYFMDLWSEEEIGDLAFLSGYEVDRMRTLAIKWGRIPRTLLQICSHDAQAERLEHVVDNAVKEAARYPERALRAIISLDNPLDPGSSSIFSVGPLKKEDGVVARHDCSIYSPTPWLTCKLADAVMVQTESAKIEFFDIMESHPYTRSTAGWIFERFIHRYLVRGETFTVHWYHDGIHTASSETLTPPYPIATYHAITELKSDPPFYWRPANANYRGIDGALVTEDCVYVMQSTIAHDHKSPQAGVDKLWNSMPLEKRLLEWKFLFIGAGEDQARNVSAPFAGNMSVGDIRVTRQQQKNKQAVERYNLPVGQVSVRPTKLDLNYISLVEELQRYREPEDGPQEGSPEAASGSH